MKVYVASSWRNAYYAGLIANLQSYGFETWDWRHPPTGGNGFGWQECGLADYEHGDKVSTPAWRQMLASQPAQRGFAADLTGMFWCDVGVLLHPCGRSAHLEAGWLAGQGKKVHVLAPEVVEPDLMVLALGGSIFETSDALIRQLRSERGHA